MRFCILMVMAANLIWFACKAMPTVETRLPCIADTAVSSYPSEVEFNYGASSRLRLKGIQMMALMKFDIKSVANSKIESAVLHMRYAGADRKLRTIGISTISAPWEEGKGVAERKMGEVCFKSRKLGKETWAGDWSDLTDVTFGSGHTVASYSDITDDGDGWFHVRLAPQIVQSMIAGLSYGIAVTDEKGQTGANNDVYSREQSNSAPYLTVAAVPIPQENSSISDVKISVDETKSTFDGAAIRLIMSAKNRPFGYDLHIQESGLPLIEIQRCQIPLASDNEAFVRGLPVGTNQILWLTPVSSTGVRGKPVDIGNFKVSSKLRPTPIAVSDLSEPFQSALMTRAGMHVFVYPDTMKAHPVTGRLLEESGPTSSFGSDPKPQHISNTAWNGQTIRLAAARGEIIAFHIMVEAPDGSLSGVEVKPEITVMGKSAIFGIYRDWYVKQGDWFPEACIPLSGTFDIPWKENAVPKQQNQSVLVELLIPKQASPGEYSGSVIISAAGQTSVTIPLRVKVSNVILGDHLQFQISLNGYGTVGGPFGLDDRTEAYRNLETNYHRLAHGHRATLALLGYGHGGTLTTDYAPSLKGSGAEMHISDWTAWDRHFGPYFDGSAFSGLPRNSVPISDFYLPFHENWPSEMSKHYHYDQTVREYPAMISEHAIKANPIETLFDKDGQNEFRSIGTEFAKHFQKMNWTNTTFQFYQNDKNYYKDPKQGGRGTSWWLLDEPNYRDDWLALAFFAKLFGEATQSAGPVKFVHREDISRPQWQRDYLDGLVQLMVVSNELYNKQPLLREYQQRFGTKFWNYGTANEVKNSNLEAEGWAIRAWLAGADGIVPWNSIGDNKNYVEPEATALLLPGKQFGISGPVASLRLKALRRAQQDVEYLIAYAASKHYDREQMAHLVSKILSIDLTFEKQNSDDAGQYRFGKLTCRMFEQLRKALAE